MKNILLFSLVLSLFICEMILFPNGSYSDAVNTTYSNDTIWERPAATTEYEMNPDLHFPVPVKFDHSGVRNDGPMETEEKKDIMLFLGTGGYYRSLLSQRFFHWNENGNLFAAVAIYKYLGFELPSDDPTINEIGSRIEDLYAGSSKPRAVMLRRRVPTLVPA